MLKSRFTPQEQKRPLKQLKRMRYYKKQMAKGIVPKRMKRNLVKIFREIKYQTNQVRRKLHQLKKKNQKENWLIRTKKEVPPTMTLLSSFTLSFSISNSKFLFLFLVTLKLTSKSLLLLTTLDINCDLILIEQNQILIH